MARAGGWADATEDELADAEEYAAMRMHADKQGQAAKLTRALSTSLVATPRELLNDLSEYEAVGFGAWLDSQLTH
jgi:hypothetical protein